MSRSSGYIHALRLRRLNALYDPVVALTSRETRFKTELLDGIRAEAGSRVLDVGCGTGTLLCMLARHAPAVRAHGIDGDPGMLERARRKAADAGLAVGLTLGMADRLPFPDGSFDHVVSSLVFHHLDREAKRRTLAEAMRVLRPGGGLHIADWGRARTPWMRAAFLAIQLTDGFATTGDHVRGRLPSMIGAAGFERVRVERRLDTWLGTLEIVRARKCPVP